MKTTIADVKQKRESYFKKECPGGFMSKDLNEKTYVAPKSSKDFFKHKPYANDFRKR